jgi:hypothetical protein
MTYFKGYYLPHTLLFSQTSIMDLSKQAQSSNSVELHKKLGLLSDELNVNTNLFL